MIASLAPAAFNDFHADVVALEFERTFWEKATILHAEYHRPATQPLRDRYARHYADFAALWKNERGPMAATRLDLLVIEDGTRSLTNENDEENETDSITPNPPIAKLTYHRTPYRSRSLILLVLVPLPIPYDQPMPYRH